MNGMEVYCRESSPFVIVSTKAAQPHSKGAQMKRFVTVCLVAVMLLAMLAFLAGCGGDSKQAKQDMQAGDKLMAEVTSMGSEMSGKVTQAFTDVSDPAKYAAAIEQVKGFANQLKAKATEAKAEYVKIKALKGVDDYVKYTDLMIIDIDSINELMTKMNEMLDKMNGAVTAGSVDQITALQEQFTKDMTNIQEKAQKAEDEANKLKQDKNL